MHPVSLGHPVFVHSSRFEELEQEGQYCISGSRLDCCLEVIPQAPLSCPIRRPVEPDLAATLRQIRQALLQNCQIAR